MTVRIGSLCSGYGGLDLAVTSVLGGTVAWHCENDPHAARVLAHRWPGVPNLGDITAVDWAGVEPVDVVTAGFPCQDISYAGRGAGIVEGNRSGLWYAIADTLGVLRPGLVVLENVGALVARRPGFDVVLADLARLGFDAEWTCVRASDVGACHGRLRCFVLAWPSYADSTRRREQGGAARGLGCTTQERHRADARRGRPGIAPDSDGDAVRQQSVAQPRRNGAAIAGQPDTSPANSTCDGRDQGRAEPAGVVRGFDAALSGGNPAGDPPIGSLPYQQISGDAARQQVGAIVGAVHRGRTGGPAEGVHIVDGTAPIVAWGPYEPAIRRWERASGRAAPIPVQPLQRGGPGLSPRFVQWLMGLPEGWVTDPAIWTGVKPATARNAQLRILGNGVVPAQCAHALRLILARTEAVA